MDFCSAIDPRERARCEPGDILMYFYKGLPHLHLSCDGRATAAQIIKGLINIPSQCFEERARAEA